MTDQRHVEIVRDGQPYSIPEYWLVGRSRTHERQGLTPHEALMQAIRDWVEQEELQAMYAVQEDARR